MTKKYSFSSPRRGDITIAQGKVPETSGATPWVDNRAPHPTLPRLRFHSGGGHGRGIPYLTIPGAFAPDVSRTRPGLQIYHPYGVKKKKSKMTE